MATIPLGRYLWERIHQVGVDTIFGVPGDFNLQFLDYIFEVKGLKWVGNQNELNGAYAADGYARIKGAPGVLVTTHGVGELSALNGIAGAMSEQVKVIHVVGQTTRPMQDNHMMIHHSIGDKPDHQVYNNSSRLLRATAAELWDVKTAPAEIDRVIREGFIQSKPVYIFLPLDLSAEEVPAKLLDERIDISPVVDKEAEQAAIAAVKKALSSAKNPSLLVDALVQRHNAVDEARKLVDKLQAPFFSTNCAKGLIDENHPKYVGLYNGAVSYPGVSAAAEASDLVIILGYLPADTNSGGFSRKLPNEETIHINPNNVIVKGEMWPNTFIKPFLKQLCEELQDTPAEKYPTPELPPPLRHNNEADTHITHSWVWPQIGKFFRSGDIVIGETGTSVFGLFDITFPPALHFFAQIYYGSIGYATAATLGAEIARKELSPSSGRTILITGDGSFNLTMQEVGTMVKEGIKPILFIINNSGYTVERLIWGADQPYNDIVPANYRHLLPLFHHPSPDKSFHRATNKEELSEILGKEELARPESLQLVEVVMEMKDTPWRLGAQIAFRGEASKKRLREDGFVDSLGDWGFREVEKGGEGLKWS